MTSSTPLQADTWSLHGLPITNFSMDAAVGQLTRWLSSPTARRIAFVNAHCVNVAVTTPAYHQALCRCDLLLPDGLGLRIASHLWRHPMIANTNGTDLLPLLFQALQGRSLFLLGAAPGVADHVAHHLRTHYPNLSIAGTHHGYFAPHQTTAIIDGINQAKPDILLVAMGVPRQELFVDQYAPHLQVPLIFSVGGLFDFLSQRIPRAPHWMRRLGMEWAFRLAKEPTRLWQRYLLGNPRFLARLIYNLPEAWSSKSRPFSTAQGPHS